MMFDPKSNELRQWTITNAKGKDTTVMIFNVQEGVQCDDRVSRVPYESIPGTPAYARLRPFRLIAGRFYQIRMFSGRIALENIRISIKRF